MLHQFLEDSAERYPDSVSVVDPAGENITYKELNRESNRLCNWLVSAGVSPGDRVGIYLKKSIDAVVSIFGILKAGSAYVPVDPKGSITRNVFILNDCSVKIIILDRQVEPLLRNEFEKIGKEPPCLLIVDSEGTVPYLPLFLKKEPSFNSLKPTKTIIPEPDDLAYILYTSGSTGKPKGVMLSHRNGTAFVDWCTEKFRPDKSDHFSSHAPFHFDLSILDIFLCIKHGAKLFLIGEEVGTQPAELSKFIAEAKISIWYSTPSVLSLLTEYGHLDKYNYSALRYILFAGEVFPLKYLRLLKQLLPQPKYFNLYGPTETNVCTFYEIPFLIPETRFEHFPIGTCCSHMEAKVINKEGGKVQAGHIGELWIRGPQVMRGYWNLEKATHEAFYPEQSGESWYRTGDKVIEDEEGNFCYIGRLDRIVKRRGYRIELGEIEKVLYLHPLIKETAALTVQREEGVQIKVFICCINGKRPSLIELKNFCAKVLSRYMVPDQFYFIDTMPKTSTSKIDYQILKNWKT